MHEEPSALPPSDETPAGGFQMPPRKDLLEQMKENPIANADRITCRLLLHHEHCCDGPVSFESTFSDMLETMEQPYQRRSIVNEKWKVLDIGWIKDSGGASLILIENRAKIGQQVTPTQEQKDDLAKKVLEISFDGLTSAMLIRPGRFQQFEAADIGKVCIRSASGDCPINLIALPR